MAAEPPALDAPLCEDHAATCYPDGLGGFACPLCSFVVAPAEAEPVPAAGAAAKVPSSDLGKEAAPTRPSPTTEVTLAQPAREAESRATSEPRTAAPTAAMLPETAETEPAKGRSVQVARIIGAALVVTVAALLLYNYSFSPAARLDAALRADRLIGPDSALEHFRAIRSAGPARPATGQAAAKIRARLEPAGAAAFASWYRDSEPANWTWLSALYAVLREVDPSTTEFAVREVYARAQGQFEARQFSEAWRGFDEALQLQPGWALALNGKAKIHVRNDSPLYDETAAVRLFQEAVAADGNFAWACKNLGEYYRQRRRWSDARRYLQEADRRLPGRPTIRESLDYVVRMETRRR